MTAPEPTPTAEHIDAVALDLADLDHYRRGNTLPAGTLGAVYRERAVRVLTSTDPAVHLAMLDALVRAGVLTPEDAPIARHGGYEHTHWQQRWDGQHTHEGRRFVTSWEVAP